MADEQKIIHVTVGPYAGGRLTTSAEEAARAIKEGWATDPFEPPSEPKELTDEERLKIKEAAEAGAKRLRGEKDEKEAAKAEPAAEAKSSKLDPTPEYPETKRKR